MLTNRHVDAYIEEKILPQQHIRRLANGSIDYTFYDRQAREGRGVAVRAALRPVATLFKATWSLPAGVRRATALQWG